MPEADVVVGDITETEIKEKVILENNYYICVLINKMRYDKNK